MSAGCTGKSIMEVSHADWQLFEKCIIHFLDYLSEIGETLLPTIYWVPKREP